MSDELRETLMATMRDALYSTPRGGEFPWDAIADAAIALIWNEVMEEAAKVAVTPCPVIPHPRECERCGNTKLKYQSPGAVGAAIRARKKP